MHKRSKKNSDQLLFLYGRDALVHLINHNSTSDVKVVAVPGFICKSITESLISANINFVYYDITPNLEIDHKSLAHCFKIEKLSAVLIIHYFGFVHENREARDLINKKQIFIIDDFCHSFGSYFFNNRRFPNSFSSVRKYFPVKVSGTLTERSAQVSAFSNRGLDYVYIFTRVSEFLVAVILRINIYNEVIDKSKNAFRKLRRQERSSDDSHDSSPTVMESALTRSFIGDEVLLRETAVRTRNNFEIYLKYLTVSGLKIVFEKCSVYDVPQWFVIESEHSVEIVKSLRKNGIGAIQWPGDELPQDTLECRNFCPVSKEASRRIALLPVHYSLTERDILHVIAKINQFMATIKAHKKADADA